MIVGENPEHCAALCLLLKQYCPQVCVVDCTTSGIDAMRCIPFHKPDLVFVDVVLPGMSGFELLGNIPDNGFDIVFTSAYAQDALAAIPFGPAGYLLKPIDPRNLQECIARIEQHSAKAVAQKLESIVERLERPVTPMHRVALPTQSGLQMVAVDLIISCTSDSNYTVLHLKGKQKIVVSRTLKEMEELLADHSFVRVHHSHLVNLNEVDKYIKGEAGCLIMSDGSQIDVSRSRKEALLQRLLHRKT